MWRSLALFLVIPGSRAFISTCLSSSWVEKTQARTELWAKGFGAAQPKKQKKPSSRRRLGDALNDVTSEKQSKNQPYVKSERDKLLASLAAKASKSVVGRAVADAPNPIEDPFWELIPSLISSKFPAAQDDELQRVAGFVRHAVDPNTPLEESIVNDPYRPHNEIHAYMPGLGETKAFHDPSQLQLCRDLSSNFEIIKEEYNALVSDMEANNKDRFQSVTSMNYESGWQTVVLFYNGHRIPGFPYHLCPVTTRILESVPLASRIGGFNRQQPGSGIPLHSDGNNMWLTCQMGVVVPEDNKASIRVGSETRHWSEGQCLLYDTTYEHETMNRHETQERVVLHVDFFNTLAMTPLEIEVMQYIYHLRGEFMKAEGVAKVGEHLL